MRSHGFTFGHQSVTVILTIPDVVGVPMISPVWGFIVTPLGIVFDDMTISHALSLVCNCRARLKQIKLRARNTPLQTANRMRMCMAPSSDNSQVHLPNPFVVVLSAECERRPNFGNVGPLKAVIFLAGSANHLVDPLDLLHGPGV